jgi:hypothetical protein
LAKKEVTTQVKEIYAKKTKKKQNLVLEIFDFIGYLT